MLEKMLGVSPPQKGLAQDSGAVDKKTLQQQAELRKEFDQKLKEQLKERPQKNANSGKDSKTDQKEKVSDKDELRADRNQKKSSGGTKKKMTEPEELNGTMISNVMASIESEVEIADQRSDLAPVETENSTAIKNDSKVGTNSAMSEPAAQFSSQNPDALAKAIAMAEGATETVEGQTVATEDVTPDQSSQDGITDEALLQQAMAAKDGAKATAVEITPEMIAAFRAAEESANADSSGDAKAAQDAQLALQMQQMANGAQPQAVSAQATTAVSTASDTSSLLAKSLENLKSIAAATTANSTEPVAATTGAAGMLTAGFGLGSDDSLSNDVATSALETDSLAQVPVSKNFDNLQNATMLESNSAGQAAQQAKQVPELTFEQQLGAEVGFEPSVEDSKDATKTALLQKLKTIESEAGMTTKEANAFELKVLAALQQERNQLAGPKSGSGEGSMGGGFSQNENQGDKLNESAKDLGPQTVGNLEASLHAGQTHQGFKSHMSTMIDRAAGMPLSPQAMAEHREENIQQVMSSAKLLAIKGGGEMVVKMSPDGMGPIELKVMMQDGKVNIEMQTQDKSVKKLIEESLTELKSGLAAQKIHVEHVKIDTVNATQTENSTSFQSNQNSSDAQGRQQEFWKQFRENFGNQGRRSSYGDVAAAPTRQQAAPNALQPVTSSAARNGARTGSTINRVA